jgi:hypothetical protein
MTNFRNRSYEWTRSQKAKDLEDESESVAEDSDESDETSSGGRRSRRILDKLRESLTEGMAYRAFKCRKSRAPRDGELDPFVEELIRSAYHCGWDRWDDDFLYTDI